MKLFYSWQSDWPGRTSRHFIPKALQEAINEIKADVTLEDADRPDGALDIELDHDTKGIGGSPDITETILAKIRASAAVVADVTPVARSGDKEIMNPNVAIEVGYALAHVGTGGLLMVMNAAHGNPRDLPFNLRHKRGPVTYEVRDDADSAATKAAGRKLAGELKLALRDLIANLPKLEPERFPEASNTSTFAQYFDEGEVLAHGETRFNIEPHEHTYTSKCFLYIRVIPNGPISPRSNAELMGLITTTSKPPLPLGSINRHPSRNSYGVILFDPSSDNSILASTQLFPTGELWSIDAEILNNVGKLPSDKPMMFFDIHKVEHEIDEWIRKYLIFTRESLCLSLPVQIEIGASGITGFRVRLPDNFRDRLR